MRLLTVNAGGSSIRLTTMEQVGSGSETRISCADSVEVCVVPVDEASLLANQALALLGR